MRLRSYLISLVLVVMVPLLRWMSLSQCYPQLGRFEFARAEPRLAAVKIEYCRTRLAAFRL